MSSTGPLCFSFAVMKYLEYNNRDIIILEPNYLESCNMNELGECDIKGKYITHVHDGSWLSIFFRIHFYLIKFIHKNKILTNIGFLLLFLIILYISLK